MINTLRKLGLERNFLNFIKNIQRKTTVNILFNVKNHEAKIRNKAQMSPLNTVLEVLANVIDNKR